MEARRSGDFCAYVTFHDPAECWAAFSVAQAWYRPRRDTDPGVTSDRQHWYLTVRYIGADGHTRPYAPRSGSSMDSRLGMKIAECDVFPGWRKGYKDCHALYSGRQ